MIHFSRALFHWIVSHPHNMYIELLLLTGKSLVFPMRWTQFLCLSSTWTNQFFAIDKLIARHKSHMSPNASLVQHLSCAVGSIHFLHSLRQLEKLQCDTTMMDAQETESPNSRALPKAPIQCERDMLGYWPT